MADDKNFGEKLFSDIGDVVSNAPQTFNTIQNQLLNLELQGQKLEQERMLNNMKMASAQSAVRLNDLKAKEAYLKSLYFLSPEMEMELESKHKFSNKIKTLTYENELAQENNKRILEETQNILNNDPTLKSVSGGGFTLNKQTVKPEEQLSPEDIAIKEYLYKTLSKDKADEAFHKHLTENKLGDFTKFSSEFKTRSDAYFKENPDAKSYSESMAGLGSFTINKQSDIQKSPSQREKTMQHYKDTYSPELYSLIENDLVNGIQIGKAESTNYEQLVKLYTPRGAMGQFASNAPAQARAAKESGYSPQLGITYAQGLIGLENKLRTGGTVKERVVLAQDSSQVMPSQSEAVHNEMIDVIVTKDNIEELKFALKEYFDNLEQNTLEYVEQ